MVDHVLYDEGYLVTIAPALNYHVQDAAEAYHAQLRGPEDGKVRFTNLTMEDTIEVIRLSDPAHAEARLTQCGHVRSPDRRLLQASKSRILNASTLSATGNGTMKLRRT